MSPITPDASGTNAFDLERLCWSAPIFQAAGLDPSVSAAGVPSTHVAGVLPQAAKACGLRPGTPVAIGGGDGCCASVGAAIQPYVAYSYLGSSATGFRRHRRPILDRNAHLQLGSYRFPAFTRRWGTMRAAGNSFNFVRGRILQNLEDQAALENTDVYRLIDRLAAATPQGPAKLPFLPYPLWASAAPRAEPGPGRVLGFENGAYQGTNEPPGGILFNLKRDP